MIYVKSEKPGKLETQLETLVQKDKRYFGKAAIGLKNQLNDPKYKEYEIKIKAVQAGIIGEEQNSKLLREWMVDKPDTLLIDSIHLNLGQDKVDTEVKADEEGGSVNVLGDTDHLLLIGNRVCILDSKNWKGKTSYKIGDDGEILRGSQQSAKPFNGSHVHTRQMLYLWKKYLSNLSTPVELCSYIVIASEDPFIMRDLNWWKCGFRLVNQKTLPYFLDKDYNEMDSHDMVRIDVLARAVMGLQKEYDKYKEQFGSVYRRIYKS